MDIFFDLDGVLLNPYPRYYKIHLLLAEKYSFKPLGYKTYIKLKQNREPEFFYLNNQHKKKCLREKLLLVENKKFLSLDILYSDVKKTLKNLQVKNNLYLITVRKKRNNLFRQLDDLKISQYFKKIYVPFSAQNIGKTPDEIKKNLLSSFLINKEKKAIIVGDTEADILTGQHYGIKTVGVTGGLRSERFLKCLKPDFVIKNIRQLPAIIKLV